MLPDSAKSSFQTYIGHPYQKRSRFGPPKVSVGFAALQLQDGEGYRRAILPRMGGIDGQCETCGNDYDKAFQVSMNGAIHTFDSFECAFHALAPTCANCEIDIIGHGLEKEGTFFCCDHCAEAKGVTGLRDRIGAGGVNSNGLQSLNLAFACKLYSTGLRRNAPQLTAAPRQD